MRANDLNYQHLRYFYAVAREGSVVKASQALHLAPSTVSAQVKVLEERLGQALFRRAGRSLVLTPFGELVRDYARQIFELGNELVAAISHGEERQRIRVGVSSVLPKLLVRDLIRPALREDVQLVLEEDTAEKLLGALAARKLDVVLSDAQMPSWMAVRGVSHLVVETGIAVFGSDALVDRVGQRLPDGLEDVPWLVPPASTSLRLGLEAWWEDVGIDPDIAAVVNDSALLKALGDQGAGVFAAPRRVMDAILDSYRVKCIGVTDKVTERVWAITLDDEPEHDAIRAICGLGDEVQAQAS